MSAEIADLLRGGATTLITGAARVAEPVPGDKRAHYYNSIQVVDGRGALLDRYDKIHLVPFGEYLPYGDFFDRFGLTQFVRIPGGFDPGLGPRVLHAPGLPDALPLICYEAVFPQEIGSLFNPDERRAGWMLNVTDDAWFGLTPGPHQHFAQARLRAIEQGLPLVRAANTGVSAVVDGLGRVIAELPLGVDGVHSTAGLPAPSRADALAYSRFGALGPARAMDGVLGWSFRLVLEAEARAVTRLLFRILGLVLLAGAFAACVIDGARSIADDHLSFTPPWGHPPPIRLLPNQVPALADLRSTRADPSACCGIRILLNILKTPTWAALAVLGAALLYAMRKRSAADRTFEPFAGRV